MPGLPGVPGSLGVEVEVGVRGGGGGWVTGVSIKCSTCVSVYTGHHELRCTICRSSCFAQGKIYKTSACTSCFAPYSYPHPTPQQVCTGFMKPQGEVLLLLGGPLNARATWCTFNKSWGQILRRLYIAYSMPQDLLSMAEYQQAPKKSSAFFAPTRKKRACC